MGNTAAEEGPYTKTKKSLPAAENAGFFRESAATCKIDGRQGYFPVQTKQ
jgi:hypothetical protein